MRITIFGAGYVGMSLAAILCVKHEVTIVEIDPDKVVSINKGQYPVNNDSIKEFLGDKFFHLRATVNPSKCKGSDYILIATPTNYDPETKHFDTSSVDEVINVVHHHSPHSTVIIRSTVPIGYTESVGMRIPNVNILFSPEFLREGNAVWDSLNPSRIIVGTPSSMIDHNDIAESFAELMRESVIRKDCEILLTGSTEAESIKLFSNTYLAMRVAFFNELDSYAELNGLDSSQIVKGVCLDPRIGDHYNNPSFGYGGYCLPKDTKQLLADYEGIPNSLIRAIVDSNRVRKEFVAGQIVKKAGNGSTIGIYRLVMKAGSDNFRESSVIDVMELLKKYGFKVIVYEPLLRKPIPGVETIPMFDRFIAESDLVVANRMDDRIEPYGDKVYCRDLFQRE